MTIQKGFCLSPDAGAQSFPGYPAGDLRVPGALNYFLETHTNWVRLIAEWEYFFPGGSTPENPPATLGGYLQALDENIMLAKSIGLNVILVTRGFPEYVNASTDPFQWPSTETFSPSGAYAQWATSLMSRYHPANRFSPDSDVRLRWIDFFEVVNEPNFEPHPQSMSVINTAEIFSTTWKIASFLNANHTVNGKSTGSIPLRLMGPATSDYASGNTLKHSNYSHFVARLLPALAAKVKTGDFDLKSPIFAWTHHNYKDVANLMPVAPATVKNPATGNRAQLVRQLLKGHWGGYAGTVASPSIFLDEGGYYRGQNNVYSESADSLQEQALSQAIERLTTMIGPGQPGEGIELFTNFLGYSATQFDSGLTRPYGGAMYTGEQILGTLRRPAYYSWKNGFVAED